MARPKKTKVKTVLVDPPSGWLYGFPKPMPVDTVDINKWLIKNGYPEKNITLLGDKFWLRYIDDDE